MTDLPPYTLDKRGKYILGELEGWTIHQKIQFLRYLLELLEDKLKRGVK